jgi:diguanylate cyclase (GGDEF)-like protein
MWTEAPDLPIQANARSSGPGTVPTNMSEGAALPSNEHTKQSLRAELRALFDRAKMPTNPALASRILKLIRDPTSSSTDFGSVIRTDAALSAKLLKTANSVPFAQRNPATTVERAVTVIGLNRVKTLSLGFQLVEHLNKLGGAPFDMRLFWQHSLLRACLARALAERRIRERSEEAFLIALLQDSGIPLLVQILGCAYSSLYQSNLSPVAFYEVERDRFAHTHVEAIVAMAAEWNLPEIIALPLERHHERPRLCGFPSEIDRLSTISYFVGSLRFTKDAAFCRDEESLREFGDAALRLDEIWTDVERSAIEEYQQLSTLYGDVLPEETDPTELLSEANHQLAQVAGETEQRVVDIQAERDRIAREQRLLQNALRDYRQRAALDPLTNVLNRGALTDAARKTIERNLDGGGAMGVLFIDLDDFKALNDRNGHQAGDTVLKVVAAILGQVVGPHGTIGRYGGEEFVAVLYGLSEKATRQMGERLLDAVRRFGWNELGLTRRITCSIGGVWCNRVVVRSAEELFAIADAHMYRAKRQGKDRYYLQALGGSAATDGQPDGTEATDGLSLHQAPAACEEISQQKLIDIATRLNTEEGGPTFGIRKEERKKLVMPCTLHHLAETGEVVLREQAVSRNVSTGGMGLVIPRPMMRGEPVEIVLEKGDSKLFLAGLVAFCRTIHGSIHEVGIQFVTYSLSPILSEDLPRAIHEHDWIARAFEVKRQGEVVGQQLG